MRSFRSDNNAGLCPEALAALVAANDGSHALGYGDDEWTRAAEVAFQRLFGADTHVFLVGTGTYEYNLTEHETAISFDVGLSFAF